MRRFRFTAPIFAVAYDPNGSASWKMDGDKIATDEGGNPILILADGKETSVKHNTVSTLNGENRTYRTRAETAETALKAFEGLDPTTARDAINKLSTVDLQNMIDKGEVEKVRNEVGQQYHSQITERDGKIGSLQGAIDNLLIEREFDRSKFIREKVGVPPEMFQATFAKNFKVEDGKVVPYDQSGNKIYSDRDHGAVASVDEAFEKLVNNYAYKDQILKAPDFNGTGNDGNGGNRSSGRTIRRSEFAGYSPAKQAEVAKAAGEGKVQIVD